MFLSICCIGFSLLWITTRKSEKSANVTLYKELQSMKIAEEGEKSTTVEEPVVVDQRPLSERNTDYKGWLSIEGTNITFPVLQGQDNEYYLNRDFYKNKSVYGSIYMDYRNKPDDKVKIIYGHNTTDGQMFALLLNFKESEYATNHQSISFGDNSYVLVSVNEINIEQDLAYWNLMLYSDERIKNVLQTYVDNSLFKSDAIINDDNYIILSTCILGNEQNRFVLIAHQV